MAKHPPWERRLHYIVYVVFIVGGALLLLIFGHDPPGPAGYIFLVGGSLSALVYLLTGVNILGGSGSSGGRGGGGGSHAP